MECVACLVQKRAHVLVDTHRIHEDERHLPERERLAVTARSLALAVVQVEQVCLRHAAVVTAELGVDMGEDIGGSADKRRDVCERLQRSATLGVRRYVPRPERVDAHLSPSPPQDALHGRHHRGLDRLVKAQAVVRRVVETILFEV